MAKKPEPAAKMQITIKPFTQRTLVVPILGTTPLIYNRMSEKAKQILLMPSRLNRKDKSEEGVKHYPCLCCPWSREAAPTQAGRSLCRVNWKGRFGGLHKFC